MSLDDREQLNRHQNIQRTNAYINADSRLQKVIETIKSKDMKLETIIR